MLSNFLNEYQQKPTAYAPGTAQMWDDPHISAGMLTAHLNPESDRASRPHDFIRRSVRWISRQTNLKPGASILDLGCGPGLYCELFAQLGHQVTGIDFSKRSIQHAQKSATEQKLEINYQYQNYLELEYREQFDLAILIFCDFGVLSPQQQSTLLRRIHTALKPKGQLIFDVFSPRHFKRFKPSKNWSFSPSGFWRPGPHLVMSQSFKYTNPFLTLEQYFVVEDERVECYRNWNRCFSMDELRALLDETGFGVESFYADVAGNKDFDTGTLAVVAKKK